MDTQDKNSIQAAGDGSDRDDFVSTIIPYRNPKALAAYYAGFFAFIPLVGILIAVVAIIFGILGVRHTLANREAKGIAHAILGIVLGTLALVCNPVYTLMLWLIWTGYFRY
jgi:hypothetical protein